MDKDWIDLLSLFDRHGVKYLIIGGWAVTFYSQPRFTKDLDLFIDSSKENAEATYRALAAFGAPLEGIEVDDFRNADAIFQMGQPPLRIDILNAVPGLNFSTAWDSRCDSEIEGITIHYVGRNDLIRSKLAAGRLQDLADAEAIQVAEQAAMLKPSGN
ncbi:nucleotidyltransferase [Terriglobus sp. RCC_193]|uniref:nucleotidyltransferase n=1 Tax=Terriglobus sp. RCC_193 TaxID=3239218 RepID=UPI003525499C